MVTAVKKAMIVQALDEEIHGEQGPEGEEASPERELNDENASPTLMIRRSS